MEQRMGLHVAIIMDGNGRWATSRGLLRAAGHRAGVRAVQTVVEHAEALGIGCLTLYAFSADNWRRPGAEVQGIFWLLRAFLRLENQRLQARGVRLEFIGRRDRLSTAVLKEMTRSEALTAKGRGLRLRIAVDYSSREAIALAAASMAARTHVVDHKSLHRALQIASLNVDLLIRTGGEKRLSDFLLWESAYAELLFTDCMWPDFGPLQLQAALQEFAGRERRFGGVPAVSLRHVTATADRHGESDAH